MAQDKYLKVKRFGVLSVAKVAAVFGIAIGVIALIFAAAIGLVRGATGFAIGLGVGIAILVAIAAALFVCGTVESFLYNIIARAIGPIRISMRKSVVSSISPLSYARVSFIFSLITYGFIAIFLSSVLFAAVGISTASIGHSIPLIVAVFVFAVLVYGFVLPLVWAWLYNWLATKIGGVSISLRKGRLERVDVTSYVKIFVSLSVIVFIVERIIGTALGLALGVSQRGGPLLIVATVVLLVVASLVVNALAALFYNWVAKKIGGIEVDIGR